MIFTTCLVNSTFLVPASSTRFWSLYWLNDWYIFNYHVGLPHGSHLYIDWLIVPFFPFTWHSFLLDLFLKLIIIGTYPTFCVVVNIAFIFQKVIGTCVIHKLSESPPHQMLWFISVDIPKRGVSKEIKCHSYNWTTLITIPYNLTGTRENKVILTHFSIYKIAWWVKFSRTGKLAKLKLLF